MSANAEPRAQLGAGGDRGCCLLLPSHGKPPAQLLLLSGTSPVPQACNAERTPTGSPWPGSFSLVPTARVAQGKGSEQETPAETVVPATGHRAHGGASLAPRPHPLPSTGLRQGAEG